MKKILSIALLLVAGMAKAQTAAPIQSFMGVKFGAAPADAIQVMSVNKATFLQTKSKKGNYVFTDATYGQLKSDYAYFKFSEDKLFEGGIFFKSDRDKTLKLYFDVTHMVALSYGEGTVKRSFTGQYVDGDGREIEAIEDGAGSIVTTWIEDPANGKKNTITLSIEPDLSVLLKFTEDKASRKG
jgi:hypothetical protein